MSFRWIQVFLLLGASILAQAQTKINQALINRANNGDISAQVTLGVYFETQVPPDYARAAKLYSKAATQGNSRGQLRLGILYENGNGVPQDYSRAATLYHKAAEQGVAMAQISLGLLYRMGHGVPQDYSQAASWFSKAAQQNDANAQFFLGSMYSLGQGVPRDHFEAYVWLSMASAGDLSLGGRAAAEKLRDNDASYLDPAKLNQAQAEATRRFALYRNPAEK